MKSYYETIALSMTPEERNNIVKNFQDKSCMNCTNGCRRVEHHEKVGLDENDKPQGCECLGWQNNEYVGRSMILQKTNIY